jgi:hypothetical protein
LASLEKHLKVKNQMQREVELELRDVKEVVWNATRLFGSLIKE